MAISKVGQTLTNETGTAATSATFDLGSASFGGCLAINITNGAVGPSAGCTVNVAVSHDNVTWLALPEGIAAITASFRSAFIFEVEGFRFVRVETGATSQSVTRLAAVSAHVLT